MKKDETMSGERLAMRVSVNTIVANVALSVFKLVAGVVGSSSAMVSDAVHSLSDVLSTFIVMIGVKMANKASDAAHPYGHERFECVAALLLAVLLGVTGIGIGYEGVRKIFSGSRAGLAAPGMLAMIAAAVSIVVKEAMYWYTRGAARKIRSGALMASAWHHRSDALSSVASFAGILGARIGYPVLDPIASVVICLFIIKVAYDIFRDAIRKMTDTSCDEETLEAIRGIIVAQEGVLNVESLKTRIFGDKMYVDVEICADRQKSLDEAHTIAQRVHDAIENSYDDVKHCMVHVNPSP